MGARSSEHTVNRCMVRCICTMYFMHIVYEYIIPYFKVFTVCTTFSSCVCVWRRTPHGIEGNYGGDKAT